MFAYFGWMSLERSETLPVSFPTKVARSFSSLAYIILSFEVPDKVMVFKIVRKNESTYHVRMSYLTGDELECLDLLAKAANLGFKIISEGGRRSVAQRGVKCDEHDAAEWALHIHICQQQIMSQAAGRLYPDIFRLLGGAHET